MWRGIVSSVLLIVLLVVVPVWAVYIGANLPIEPAGVVTVDGAHDLIQRSAGSWFRNRVTAPAMEPRVRAPLAHPQAGSPQS